MAARITREYQSSTEAQAPCARGDRCTARTRDAEGEWHPAAATQHLCPADQDVMTGYLGELPGMYERLAGMSVNPVRRARPVRVPPGSRVLASPESDALMRVIAPTIGGWAARVRAVPQLSLTTPAHPHGTIGRVAADCATLAAHPGPLLALPHGPMTRIWTWPPGEAMPAWLDGEIGGLEAVHGGDGWVKAWTSLNGRDAALDIIDLHHAAVRLLQEAPAPRDLLDGIPCRKCEAMSSLEVLPSPPPDPKKPEQDFCQCSVPGCHDRMTRGEYDDWVRQYDAYARGAGIQSCRRCARGDCDRCQWRACQCAASGHQAAS